MALTRTAGLRPFADTLLGAVHVAVALLGVGAALLSLALGPSLQLRGARVVSDFATVYHDTRPGSWQAVAVAARASAIAHLASEQPYCFAFTGALVHPARLGAARWRSFSYALQWLEFSLQPRARRQCRHGVARVVFGDAMQISVR